MVVVVYTNPYIFVKFVFDVALPHYVLVWILRQIVSDLRGGGGDVDMTSSKFWIFSAIQCKFKRCQKFQL